MPMASRVYSATCIVIVVAALISTSADATTASNATSGVPCKEYLGREPDIPANVSQFIHARNAAFVDVCKGLGHTVYSSGGPISQSGDVCTFEFRSLISSDTGELRFGQNPGQMYMRLARPNCGIGMPADYTGVQDVSKKTFVRLMRMWGNALSSLDAFRSYFWVASDSAPYDELRDAVAQKRSDRLVVNRLLVRRHLTVWTEYEMQIINLNHPDRYISVSITELFGVWDVISDVQRGMY